MKLQKKIFSLADFGIKTKRNVKIPGFEKNPLACIPVNDGYVWDKNLLRDINNFMGCSFGDGLLIFGPKGSGKTSCVEQYCARLNIPLISESCKETSEASHWVGGWRFINGNMEFVDGCLTQAVRFGYTLLLNEIDIVSPGEVMSLNGILSGSPLFIAEKNEVVPVHENFRLIATANSNGTGDQTGIYSSVQRMNSAFIDRFMKVKADYLNKEEELRVIKSYATGVPVEILEKMIKVANKVRRLHTAEDGSEIETTFSTRTLIRWAIQCQRMYGMEGLLKYTLDRSLLFGCPNDVEVSTIEEICIAVFGDDYK